MRSSARSAVPALLALLCLTTVLFAQAPAKPPAVKTPRGSISGRIMLKDKPAPGVVAGLRRTDNLNPFDQYSLKATTDRDGVYSIKSVPAGSYQVVVVAPGYVASDSSNSRQAVVVVGEDENVDNVDFTLVRGAVITGKVTDADGKPLIQMSVSVYRTDPDKQAPFRAADRETTGQTDDRGVYRIFGLMPGKFKVAAGRRDDVPDFAFLGRNYKQVFHPDATDEAKATIIELGEGSEAKNIDITLGRAVQTFSISGRVLNTDTNAPIPDVMFGLQRVIGDRNQYVSTTISSNARGEFVAEGLTPGKYTVIQFGNITTELRLESMTFDVIDQDVTDLTIRLARGASVSGFLIIESDDKGVRGKLSEMMLRAFVQPGPGTASSSASSPIAADGSFRLSGLQPGLVNMMLGGVNLPFPPKGFSISRIERDGVVTPRVEVRDGENVTGVKIFVSYGTGSLRGLITVENGTLPPGARFFVRITKPGDHNIYLQPPAVDARGHFMMEGIPPGTYEVAAAIMGANIKIPPPVTRTVTVTDGAVTDLAFTIDMSGQTPTNP